MTEDERAIRQRLKDDYQHYASKCLKIRTKSGQVEPFLFNRAQEYIHQRVEEQRAKTGKVRSVILKGRQQGCSTLIEGRFYWRITHSIGAQAFILTHALDATNNLYRMVQRYHENCPALVRPEAATSNSKELIFGKLDSGYKIGTAENKSVGRSATIQLLHGSEVAFWANASEHAKGIMQAVPNDRGTEVFLESTANGVGGYFHEQWQLAETGQSDFIAIFVPWFWQPEYVREVDIDFIATDEEEELREQYELTTEQLAWRRYKIVELSSSGGDGVKSFKQEYPCNPVEAFQISGEDTFITSDAVMRARKIEADPWGPMLIGVDPARYGDDRTSIVRRKGRVAYMCESYAKKSTMEVCGIVHRIITDEEPDKVFIDIGGLGAGIYDRLIELGHKDVVVAVNSANSPLDMNKYSNKRAEMWAVMKEWLLDQPAQIPDNDTLHADLCSVKYTFDSKGRLMLERKEAMKKRGLRSPDEADALALTFAYPVSALSAKKEIETARKLMSTFNRTQKLKGARNNGGR